MNQNININIHHKDWNDNLSLDIDNNIIKRMNNNDEGKFILTDSFLLIIWEKWEKESLYLEVQSYDLWIDIYIDICDNWKNYFINEVNTYLLELNLPKIDVNITTMYKDILLQVLHWYIDSNNNGKKYDEKLLENKSVFDQIFNLIYSTNEALMNIPFEEYMKIKNKLFFTNQLHLEVLLISACSIMNNIIKYKIHDIRWNKIN